MKGDGKPRRRCWGRQLGERDGPQRASCGDEDVCSLAVTATAVGQDELVGGKRALAKEGPAGSEQSRRIRGTS